MLSVLRNLICNTVLVHYWVLKNVSEISYNKFPIEISVVTIRESSKPILKTYNYPVVISKLLFKMF